MQATLALVVALASVASAAPQGVTAIVAPTTAAPAGCTSSQSGEFEITAFNISSDAKRDLEKRTCDASGSLTLTLAGGILKDAQGRTGYIAANHQFQFDAPPQTGAIFTAGWSVCSNGSLALGGSNVFYQCKSGNPNGGDAGAFFNLYDSKVFDICTPAVINILPCGGTPAGGVGQQPDGQPTGGSAGAPPVSQINDGQPQAPSGIPISQLSDGQPQVPTAIPAPISQITDGQIQAPTGAPISQITDGQVQAPTGAPITQISDGQAQAPTQTVAPITQITDGQVQAPTGAPITQITDGQVQAPTGAPITQISDGQIQAPTSTASGAVISQIPDGQVQSGNTTTAPIPSPVPVTLLRPDWSPSLLPSSLSPSCKMEAPASPEVEL